MYFLNILPLKMTIIETSVLKEVVREKDDVSPFFLHKCLNYNKEKVAKSKCHKGSDAFRIPSFTTCIRIINNRQLEYDEVTAKAQVIEKQIVEIKEVPKLNFQQNINYSSKALTVENNQQNKISTKIGIIRQYLNITILRNPTLNKTPSSSEENEILFRILCVKI